MRLRRKAWETAPLELQMLSICPSLSHSMMKSWKDRVK